MEVIHGLPKCDTDIIIHSPGGSPTVAESIVSYLRQQYVNKEIRVIIPHLAMSAATMIALSADRIIMGKHSFIGPIDPQIHIPGPSDQLVLNPAFAIIKQYKDTLKNIIMTLNLRGVQH